MLTEISYLTPRVFASESAVMGYDMGYDNAKRWRFGIIFVPLQVTKRVLCRNNIFQLKALASTILKT